MALNIALGNCKRSAIVAITKFASSARFFSYTSCQNQKLAPLNFINGERCYPSASDSFDLREPATGKLLGEVQCSCNEDVLKAVSSAGNAFEKWSAWSGIERAAVLNRAADIIRQRKDEIAKWDSVDTGRCISELQFDVNGAIETLEYYASLATTSTGRYVKLENDNFAYVTKEPYGVVAAIGSWNFPFCGATWKVAPALASGNTMVFKPSPLAPITTTLLAEIIHDAGAPPGILNVVQGEAKTGGLLCQHGDVAKVSFTGGIQTGAKIMASCAPGIKDVTLELGGKSPLIIFPDCDMDNAINAALNANFELVGQSCTNGTRVFLHESIKDEFTKRIVERTKKIKVGHPADSSVQMGALISEDHLNKVLGYVQSAKDEGAEILCGGERLQMSGYYMSPCVLTNCRDDMKVVQEEIFGPVISILSFSKEEEVIKRANDTNYGLASGLFTSDITRAHRVAAKLKAGQCWINTYSIFRPQFPTGGFKHSGIGRENGQEGFDSYTQTKTVYVGNGNVETPY
ncbi:4-trimethylaminobutyraldehyde dehydrogenase-like [Dendronephthya gigantea]|uniref:4-trimethylaminobutyraldehyde dehydrogenase-like n=1 Tax=Dendronephthya gigantea TaxID=151771 RepID=UPI00106C4130|nr:4-trimethylaminobutyraldehyde dehydrogenase-like [Dendronephthya gigantea]